MHGRWIDNVTQSTPKEQFFCQKTETLFFVIERITPENKEDWCAYAEAQYDCAWYAQVPTPAANRPACTIIDCKHLTNASGAYHFYESLKRDLAEENETDLWVAYVARKKPTEIRPIVEIARELKQQKQVLENSIRSNQFYDWANFPEDDIEMFVTLATSAKALCSTHLGISRTISAALDLHFGRQESTLRHNQISLPLHKFCFGFTKFYYNTQRDATITNKQYMITYPTYAMGKIFERSLTPQQLHLGTTFLDKMQNGTEQPNREHGYGNSTIQYSSHYKPMVQVIMPKYDYDFHILRLLDSTGNMLVEFDINTNPMYQFMKKTVEAGCSSFYTVNLATIDED